MANIDGTEIVFVFFKSSPASTITSNADANFQ